MADEAGPSRPNFSHIPYEQRWDYLKPTIVNLYMNDRLSLADLSRRMKEDYGFDAPPASYRYRFRNWDIKKRTTAEEKEGVITALGKRLRPGASTSMVTLHEGGIEKPVDKKNLKRYLGECVRHDAGVSLEPGIFLHWNHPGKASQAEDGTSPYRNGPDTPENVSVRSPPAAGPSQDAYDLSSAHNAMSPTAQLVAQKLGIDRSRLLVQGRYADLWRTLTGDERRVLRVWLHDFWIYGFITAKYWGKGPEMWTAELITARNLQPFSMTGSSPHSPTSRALSLQAASPSGAPPMLPSPTRLCRWTIHYEETVHYERVHSPTPQPREQDIEDETTWNAWSSHESHPSFAETIAEGLSSNGFSEIDRQDLAISADTVVQAAHQAPQPMAVEALGFAIMARQGDLVEKFWRDHRHNPPEEVKALQPFHLAASYMEGGKTCCSMMDSLVTTLQGEISIGANYIDTSGRTVLDQLFINIIRSHTSVTPGAVSPSYRGETHFPGEEVDMCGRWDADSPCIRQLYASGNAAIPFEWKHAFCHTSAQAICHSISALFIETWSPDINTPSGLYIERCRSCGRNLVLRPLHCLVVTAFHLANSGTEGETLFGILACLVCLLVHGTDPTNAAELSVPLLLGYVVGEDCTHRPLSPSQLASMMAADFMPSWAQESRLGWEVLVAILQLAESERERLMEEYKNKSAAVHQEMDIDDDSSSNEDSFSEWESGLEPWELYRAGNPSCPHEWHRVFALEHYEDGMNINHFCGSRALGGIWAAIQTELLTYRRIRDGDPWLSDRFDLQLLLKGLHEGVGADLPTPTTTVHDATILNLWLVSQR